MRALDGPERALGVATRGLLMLTALDMFEERGFDQVSVAEIAEAAGVSKKTVFNYFAVKEDLVLGFGSRHIDEPAEAVRTRAPGRTPLEAVRDYVLTGLAEHQPMLGLSDNPLVMRVVRLIERTPALAVRQMEYMEMTRARLAEALLEEGGSGLSARMVAAQLHAAQQVLAGENFRRISQGETPEEIYPDAVAVAERTFEWLRTGMGDTLRRPDPESDSDAESDSDLRRPDADS